MKHTLILHTYLEEHIINDGATQAVLAPTCVWALSREIAIPFKPYKGLILKSISADDMLDFEVGNISFDIKTGKWKVPGKINIMLEHERTQQKMQKMFPGWTIESEEP